MKHITSLCLAELCLCLLLMTASCKSESKNETAADNTPIPTVSYQAMMVKSQVASYPVWKEVYTSRDSIRKANGMEHYFIARGTEDTNTVLVFNRVTNLPKAKDFMTSPDIKMAMEKAGVTGPPTIVFMDVLRDENSTIPQNERVMVAHRVKDYDAWLKVFDAEGKAKRAEYGILDRGLAREIGDPNMVYLVFALTDKEKALARMQSEELKKVMMDAGVEGEPNVYFYTLQP